MSGWPYECLCVQSCIRDKGASDSLRKSLLFRIPRAKSIEQTGFFESLLVDLGKQCWVDNMLTFYCSFVTLSSRGWE